MVMQDRKLAITLMHTKNIINKMITWSNTDLIVSIMNKKIVKLLIIMVAVC